MAKSAVCHSGRFAAKRATRSPGFTPNSKKAFDNPAMRRRNSFDEISCEPAPVRNICARGFGHVSMACKKFEGSVPELMSDNATVPQRKMACNEGKRRCVHPLPCKQRVRKLR